MKKKFEICHSGQLVGGRVGKALAQPLMMHEAPCIDKLSTVTDFKVFFISFKQIPTHKLNVCSLMIFVESILRDCYHQNIYDVRDGTIPRHEKCMAPPAFIHH